MCECKRREIYYYCMLWTLYVVNDQLFVHPNAAAYNETLQPLLGYVALIKHDLKVMLLHIPLWLTAYVLMRCIAGRARTQPDLHATK